MTRAMLGRGVSAGVVPALTSVDARLGRCREQEPPFVWNTLQWVFSPVLLSSRAAEPLQPSGARSSLRQSVPKLNPAKARNSCSGLSVRLLRLYSGALTSQRAITAPRVSQGCREPFPTAAVFPLPGWRALVSQESWTR